MTGQSYYFGPCCEAAHSGGDYRTKQNFCLTAGVLEGGRACGPNTPAFETIPNKQLEDYPLGSNSEMFLPPPASATLGTQAFLQGLWEHSPGQVLAAGIASLTSRYFPLLHSTEKSQRQPGNIHRRTSVLLEDSRHEHKIK